MHGQRDEEFQPERDLRMGAVELSRWYFRPSARQLPMLSGGGAHEAGQLRAEPSDEREGREATGEETAEVVVLETVSGEGTRLGEAEAAAEEAA